MNPLTGDTPLLESLRARLLREGPLTFAQFMEAVLYHPEHGYYLQPRSPLGREGDFVTAPDHHPAFGRLVGRRLLQVAEELGASQDFTVVEMGAGSGALAEGILIAFAEADRLVRYRILEPFPVWRERQKARLATWAPSVEWLPGLEECPPFTGAFVSNELPDSFPVHRVVFREGRLRELWVTHTSIHPYTHTPTHPHALSWREGDPSTPALSEYFERLGCRPPDGKVVEVNLELAPWATRVAARLVRGSFLTIDYGATAGELFGDGRAEGALRSYRDQGATRDPLAAPGRQDLTADVDFTTLIRTCEVAGLRLRAFTTQRDFCLAMGWRKWLREGPEGGRWALTDLIDPRLMGKTRVLEMTRG